MHFCLHINLYCMSTAGRSVERPYKVGDSSPRASYSFLNIKYNAILNIAVESPALLIASLPIPVA